MGWLGRGVAVVVGIGLFAACAEHVDAAHVDIPPPMGTLPVASSSPDAAPAHNACAQNEQHDEVTGACITACGEQPRYTAVVKIDPTCTNPTLRDGTSFHDQLTVQLSSGATTRVDCPRMRYRNQNTPVCVTKVVDGRVRGACCPPGHTDPTAPECVQEGSVDEMFKRPKIWEWCKHDALPQVPCEPCVWTQAEKP